MRILVTGATGAIGGAAARRWAALGLGRTGEAHVTALVRRPQPAETLALEKAGVRVVPGDVYDAQALARVVEGHDLIVHAALEMRLAHPMKIWRENVEGARVLFDAAAATGVKHFIFTSSLSVYGSCADVGEEAPLEPSGELYSDARLAAELCLAEAARLPGAPGLAVLRLGNMYGPGVKRWTEEPLRQAQRRALRAPGGGRFPFPYLYIENMVDALTAVAVQRIQGVYNIYDGVTSGAEFLSHYARMTRTRLGFAPLAWQRGLALLAEVTGWLVGRYPANNRKALQALLRGANYPARAEKAAQTFNWHPRISLAEGMAAIEQHNGFHAGKQVENPWVENPNWMDGDSTGSS